MEEHEPGAEVTPSEKYYPQFHKEVFGRIKRVSKSGRVSYFEVTWPEGTSDEIPREETRGHFTVTRKESHILDISPEDEEAHVNYLLSYGGGIPDHNSTWSWYSYVMGWHGFLLGWNRHAAFVTDQNEYGE